MRTLFIFSLLTLAACSPVTELIVDVRTDLRVPEEIDRVELRVDARAAGHDIQVRQVPLSEAADLPARFVVVHSSGDLGPIRLDVSGLRDIGPVVTQELEVFLVEGRSVLVSVELTEACEEVRCAPGEVCSDGLCRAIQIEDDAGGRMDAGRSPDAGPGDAGSPDAGPPDAGFPDSGVLPCAERPSCDEGRCECEYDTPACGCALTCGAGEDCDAHCHDDIACTVDARGGSNVGVHCKDASCVIDARGASNAEDIDCDGDDTSCDINCEDTSNCRVRCRRGASCVVRCAGASNCDIDECDGGELSACGSGVYACRRPCP